MKKHIKKALINLSRSKIERAPFPVFLKHGVVASPGPLFTKKYDNQEPEVFYKQIKHLQSYFDFISLNEAIKLSLNGQSLVGKCALTFDDGYACLAKNVFPVLDDMQVPATVFIISNVVDDAQLFWRDQIRHLAVCDLTADFISFYNTGSYGPQYTAEQSLYAWSKAAVKGRSKDVQKSLADYFSHNNISITAADQTGCSSLFLTSEQINAAPAVIEFGNHTASHPAMSSLGYDEQVHEISSCQTFLDSLQRPHVPILSLPFGMANDETVRAAQALGYKGIVYHSDRGKNAAEKIAKGYIDRYTLPDTRIDLGWMLLNT